MSVNTRLSEPSDTSPPCSASSSQKLAAVQRVLYKDFERRIIQFPQTILPQTKKSLTPPEFVNLQGSADIGLWPFQTEVDLSMARVYLNLRPKYKLQNPHRDKMFIACVAAASYRHHIPAMVQFRLILSEFALCVDPLLQERLLAAREQINAYFEYMMWEPISKLHRAYLADVLKESKRAKKFLPRKKPEPSIVNDFDICLFLAKYSETTEEKMNWIKRAAELGCDEAKVRYDINRLKHSTEHLVDELERSKNADALCRAGAICGARHERERAIKLLEEAVDLGSAPAAIIAAHLVFDRDNRRGNSDAKKYWSRGAELDLACAFDAGETFHQHGLDEDAYNFYLQSGPLYGYYRCAELRHDQLQLSKEADETFENFANFLLEVCSSCIFGTEQYKMKR